MNVIDVAIGVAIGRALNNLFVLPDYITDTDSTDLNEDHRSGMSVYIDFGTRLTYLSTANGGLTPRLNASGQHIRLDENDPRLKPKTPKAWVRYTAKAIVAIIVIAILFLTWLGGAAFMKTIGLI